MKIELEEEWQKQKDARIAAANATPKRGSHFWWVLTVLVIGGLCVGGWYYVTHVRPHSVAQPHS